jgi:DNA modification methylase
MHNDSWRLQFGGLAEPPDRLILGDCLDVFRGLAPSCLDLVYIDPPFGTGKAKTTRADRALRSYADTFTDPEAFIAWLLPRLDGMRAALAPSGSLFLHLDYRAVHYAKVALDRLFGRDRFVNEIIWCYSVGGKSRRSFGRKHDTILWYAKTRDYAFYPDEVRVPRKPSSHMRVVRGDDGVVYQEKTHRKTGKVYRYPAYAGKIPEDWWTDIETLNRSDRERIGWPTQKPERLLERLVRAASAPGALVADGFCGSGTTAVVAQRLGRRFLASDIEREAIACASERLRDRGQELAGAGVAPPDVVVELRERGADLQLELADAHSSQQPNP